MNWRHKELAAGRWFRMSLVEQLANADQVAPPGSIPPRRYVLWDHSRACVHAHTFGRTIGTDQGPLPIMALAGVAVIPEWRGRGLGRSVVRRAFSRVDSGEFAASLFQTDVPDFYRKIGCCTVHNRFINSLSSLDPTANPWLDNYVMVYPDGFAWPDGVIDLNGAAY